MLLRALAIASLGSLALAGGVANVSHTPIVVHGDFQSAIDAAQDGDVLLAHGGSYPGFAIDDRSIAIFTVPGETVVVQDKVEIRNVASSRRVVLSDLRITAGMDVIDGETALSVLHCDGAVWVQGCTLVGGDGFENWNGGPPDGGDGGGGVRVFDSRSVVIVGSTLRAGKGGRHVSSGCYPDCYFPGTGGTGLVVDGVSRVAVYDSDAFGGDGGHYGVVSGFGGDGMAAYSATAELFAANCSATGGDGGLSGYSSYGDGGRGVFIAPSAQYATLLACSCAGGDASGGAQRGAPILGAVQLLDESVRTMTTARIVRDATEVDATFGGIHGDLCFAPSSTLTGWFLNVAANGVWTILHPAKMPKTPLAVIGSSAIAVGAWLAPDVGAGAQALAQFRQGYVMPADGGAVLATPACVLVLDTAALPDCDANGVFDVLDVVEGARDLNQNFANDACERLTTWYVDDSAAPGGDGSLGAPFQTIQQGMNAASSGEEVVVLDGTYVGPQNRNSDFGGKGLIVRSLNGPLNCVIDCQDLGRAFHLHSDEPLGTRIEGFTVLDGWIHPSTYVGDGGGVLVENGAQVEIVDCAFHSCVANHSGGAICRLDTAGGLRVFDCSFTFNSAWSTGGAICVAGDAEISRCVFQTNQAGSGGAIRLNGDGTLKLSHSELITNWGDTGGAVSVFSLYKPKETRLRASHLLCVGNQSHLGAAIAVTAPGVPRTGADVSIAHSTFTKNHTTQAVPALYLTYATTSLENCIFWNDYAYTFEQEIQLQGGTLTVSFCDIEGGFAGVQLVGGLLDWGAGNLGVDPGFVDPDGADGSPWTFGDNVYRLLPTSPCVDAGNAYQPAVDFTDVDGDLDFAEPVPLDLNRKPRFTDLPSVLNTGLGLPPIDIGCYERQN